jgi:hypothetical protein
MLNISHRPILVAASLFLGVVSGFLYSLEPTTSEAKPFDLAGIGVILGMENVLLAVK